MRHGKAIRWQVDNLTEAWDGARSLDVSGLGGGAGCRWFPEI
jgi:hypothetical protein